MTSWFDKRDPDMRLTSALMIPGQIRLGNSFRLPGVKLTTGLMIAN